MNIKKIFDLYNSFVVDNLDYVPTAVKNLRHGDVIKIDLSKNPEISWMKCSIDIYCLFSHVRSFTFDDLFRCLSFTYRGNKYIYVVDEVIYDSCIESFITMSNPIPIMHNALLKYNLPFICLRHDRDGEKFIAYKKASIKKI